MPAKLIPLIRINELFIHRTSQTCHEGESPTKKDSRTFCLIRVKKVQFFQEDTQWNNEFIDERLVSIAAVKWIRHGDQSLRVTTFRNEVVNQQDGFHHYHVMCTQTVKCTAQTWAISMLSSNCVSLRWNLNPPLEILPRSQRRSLSFMYSQQLNTCPMPTDLLHFTNILTHTIHRSLHKSGRCCELWNQ